MEQRLERIENMVGQLITMVGNVLTEQQHMRKDMADMRKDIDRLSSDMQVIKDQLADVTKANDFLVHKSGEHEKDIYILKHK